MKNIRLFWQIFPAILLTTIISLAAVVWYISATSRDFYLEQLQEGLKNRALLIESPIVTYADTSHEELQKFIRTMKTTNKWRTMPPDQRSNRPSKEKQGLQPGSAKPWDTPCSI